MYEYVQPCTCNLGNPRYRGNKRFPLTTTAVAAAINNSSSRVSPSRLFLHLSGVGLQVAWLLSLAEASDPSVRTSKGETALHLAAARGDEAVCRALLEGGCPPEAVTREGKTALHFSAEMGERQGGRAVSWLSWLTCRLTINSCERNQRLSTKIRRAKRTKLASPREAPGPPEGPPEAPPEDRSC